MLVWIFYKILRAIMYGLGIKTDSFAANKRIHLRRIWYWDN